MKPITPEQKKRITENTVAFAKQVGDLAARHILEADPERDRAELMAEISAGTLAASAMLTQLSGMDSKEAGLQYAEGVRICENTPIARALGDSFEVALRKLRAEYQADHGVDLDPTAN